MKSFVTRFLIWLPTMMFAVFAILNHRMGKSNSVTINIELMIGAIWLAVWLELRWMKERRKQRRQVLKAVTFSQRYGFDR